MSWVTFKVEHQKYTWMSNFHKETLGEFILKVAIEDTLEGEIHNLLRVAIESDEFVVEGEGNASSIR